jgi:hypothetical protein
MTGTSRDEDDGLQDKDDGRTEDEDEAGVMHSPYRAIGHAIGDPFGNR